MLRLPGVSFHSGARRSAVGKHIPDKIAVTLAEEYFTVIKWNFRSLEASGDLREGDFLVVGPRREHLEGLAIGRPQWLFRPGDLVPVKFAVNATPLGYYVPVDAITLDGERHVVFVVEEGKARRVSVTVHDSFEELRRIEGDGLKPGLQIIVVGVHYVSDGELVSITGRESLSE